jgi:hypothetical protein
MGFIYYLSFGLLSLPLLDTEVKFIAFLENDFYWLNMALLYVSIGFMVLWLGYYSRIALWIEHILHIDKKSFHIRLYPHVIFYWILILYAIGSIARIYLISTGTFGYLKAQYRDIAEAQLGFAHFLTHVQLFCSYALVLAAICYFTQRRVIQKVTFYSVTFAEVFFGIVSGFRTPILFTFFFIGVTHYYVNRKIPLRYICIGFMVLLFSFPFIQSYRILINIESIDTKDSEEVIYSLWSILDDMINKRGAEIMV